MLFCHSQKSHPAGEIPSGLAKIAPSDNVISHADVIKSYCGLLAQAKSDFVAIEQYRSDDFFRESLGNKQVPSEDTKAPCASGWMSMPRRSSRRFPVLKGGTLVSCVSCHHPFRSFLASSIASSTATWVRPVILPKAAKVAPVLSCAHR